METRIAFTNGKHLTAPEQASLYMRLATDYPNRSPESHLSEIAAINSDPAQATAARLDLRAARAWPESVERISGCCDSALNPAD